MKNNKLFVFNQIGILGVIGLFIFVIINGGGFQIIVNIPSIFFTYGITFFLLLSLFGKDFISFICDSIKAIFIKPDESNIYYVEISKYGSRYVIGIGVILSIIGLIQMLSDLSDPAIIPIGLAKILLPIFYALIASEVYFAFTYRVFMGNKGKKDQNLNLKWSILLIGIALILIILILAIISFN